MTYPIVSALLGAPKVKAIRGLADFGFSYVYVIFEGGTDIYWARSRVLEYMQSVKLPTGAQMELGPDATGVGWVFQYALVDKSGKHDLAELRAFQDWSLRYALRGVTGVAEVAGFGGFEKQYQVTIDPVKLHGFGLGVMEIAEAIKRNNNETGGRLIEWSGREYMVRARGYIQDKSALEQIVVKTSPHGTPVLLRDVADIALGPQMGVRDYIHVVDLARGHVAALNRLRQLGGVQTWNLGTGHGVSVLDMVRAFEAASGRKVPYQIVARRAGDVAQCWADPARAAHDLGWRAEYDLPRMFADAWRWQSASPEGYA